MITPFKEEGLGRFVTGEVYRQASPSGRVVVSSAIWIVFTNLLGFSASASLMMERIKGESGNRMRKKEGLALDKKPPEYSEFDGGGENC